MCKANYTGGIVENDLAPLHKAPGNRLHFEALKRLLKQNGIDYAPFSESRAQILEIRCGAPKRVYFTGGTTWWGFQQRAVQTMLEAAPAARCVLLIFASGGPHYWWIEPDGSSCPAETGRWLFSEPKPGALQVPQVFSSQKALRLKEEELIDKLRESSLQAPVSL